MPACTKKRDGLWRVVECSNGKIVKNEAGTAVDGGGYASREKALKQASAINMRSR